MRPAPDEAAPYYFKYIDRVATDDVLGALLAQLPAANGELAALTEEGSHFRYADGRWSAREVLAHVNDCERVFLTRAHWFARGLPGALPSFETDLCAQAAPGDAQSWASHLHEFRAIRHATLAFYQNLPAEAWSRRGTASEMVFTVRALAYITAGHFDHHLAVLRERYRLPPRR